MIKWFKANNKLIIRNSFLLPILLVVIMSISHVVSWYDIGNPYNWAIYLSIAIEVFALASVAASTIKMGRGSIWFLFGLVTFIQILGNIFFEFRDINPLDEGFIAWMQLIEPIFDDFEVIDHQRLLAAIQGGTLPIMSLTALHYYIKFTDNESPEVITEEEVKEDPVVTDAPNLPQFKLSDIFAKKSEDSNINEEAIKKELSKTVEVPVESEIKIATRRSDNSKKIIIDSEVIDTDEYKNAMEYWGKMKGPSDNIEIRTILDFYRAHKNVITDKHGIVVGTKIDPNTGKLNKKNDN